MQQPGRRSSIAPVILLFALGVASCAAGGEGSVADGGGGGVSLRRDIMPILAEAGCAAALCHSDPQRPMTHFSDLRTPETVYRTWVNSIGFNHCVAGSDQGLGVPTFDKKRVVPGDPDASLLMEKILETRDACTPFYGRMPPPPSAPLAPAQIDTIRRWIIEGALPN